MPRFPLLKKFGLSHLLNCSPSLFVYKFSSYSNLDVSNCSIDHSSINLLSSKYHDRIAFIASSDTSEVRVPKASDLLVTPISWHSPFDWRFRRNGHLFKAVDIPTFLISPRCSFGRAKILNNWSAIEVGSVSRRWMKSLTSFVCLAASRGPKSTARFFFVLLPVSGIRRFPDYRRSTWISRANSRLAIYLSERKFNYADDLQPDKPEQTFVLWFNCAILHFNAAIIREAYFTTGHGLLL